MDPVLREGLLLVADRLCHLTLDPYINATVLGLHLPGWGRLQLWQHYLCCAYEELADANKEAGQRELDAWNAENGLV